MRELRSGFVCFLLLVPSLLLVYRLAGTPKHAWIAAWAASPQFAAAAPLMA